MKKVVIILSVLLSCSFAYSQDNNTYDNDNGDEMRTLFGNLKHVGGYGAFNMGYSPINELDGMTIGGSLALIINHNFGIGIKGEGFFSESQRNTIFMDDIN